ncbi:hypothetical protein TWF281_006960 [Arthrobotrys megalospora]
MDLSKSPEDSSLPSTAQAFAAVKLLLNFLDQNVIALIAIGFFAPTLGIGWGRDWNRTSHMAPNYGLWALGVPSFAVLAAAIVSSCSVTFAGQLKYAYNEGRGLMASFRKHIPLGNLSPLVNRSPHILIFLFVLAPDSWVFILLFVSAVAFAAWQYVLYSYRCAVQEITAQADELCYKAKVALHSSRQNAIAASKYEKQVIDLADTSRRNDRLAKSTDITDFFDKTATAWASMDRIAEPMRIMTEKARRAKEHAEAIADPGFGDNDEDDENEGEDEDEDVWGQDSSGTELLDSANAAVSLCEEIKKELDHAQSTIKDSATAQKNFQEVRRIAADYAKAAESALSELALQEKDNFNTLSLADASFERVKWLTDQAKRFATRSDMALANNSVSEAEAEMRRVVDAEHRILTNREKAHQILVGLQSVQLPSN